MNFSDLKRAVRFLSKAGTSNETEVIVTQDLAHFGILSVERRRNKKTGEERVTISIESGTETFGDEAEVESGISKEEYLAEHADCDEGPTGDGWEGFE